MEYRRMQRTFCSALLFAAVVLVPTGVARAQVSDHCVVARVPSPFLMPDGSSHPAGAIRVCMSRQYSPVAGLHRTYVDGEFAGMYLSRFGVSEGLAEETRPFFMFYREDSGRLALVGYALRDGERFRTFRMERIGRQKADSSRSPAAPDREDDDAVNVLAAVLR